MSKPEDFVIENGVLIKYIGTDTDIIIPDDVEKIEDKAFKDCCFLTNVTLTDAVKRIGNYAFKGCNSLKIVMIPYSETEIGYKAFGDLTEIIIKCPEGSVPENYAVRNRIKYVNISGKSVQKDFVIKDGVLIKYVGTDMAVFIPDNVTNIGSQAFFGCTGLKSVAIPEGVTSIGNYAFHNCTNLTSITIPNSVTSVGHFVFSGCENAMIIYNCKYIDYLSFVSDYYDEYSGKCYFPKIPIKDLPKQLKFAAVKGFAEMYSKTEVPQNLVSDYFSYLNRNKKKYYSKMASGTFLLKFIIDKRIITIDEIDDAIDSADDTEVKTILIEYKKTFDENEREESEKKKDDEFDKIIGLKELTLKDYKNIYGMEFVKIDDNYILKKCKGTEKSVTIPTAIKNAKVTAIDKNAFNDSKVEKIVISDNITSIDDYTFNGCTDLISITIPDSVKSIGACAFEGCAGLTGITIPNSVTSIGNYAFCGCRNLTNATIGKCVTSIGDHAFDGCINLTRITIPNNVTNIGSCAFYECTNLTSVTISNSVTSIDNYAFSRCTCLKSVTIPDSVTNIDNYAFSICRNLTDITIPDSVTNIGNYAFCGCGNLIINCVKNSYAHKYAIENNIKFELI